MSIRKVSELMQWYAIYNTKAKSQYRISQVFLTIAPKGCSGYSLWSFEDNLF